MNIICDCGMLIGFSVNLGVLFLLNWGLFLGFCSRGLEGDEFEVYVGIRNLGVDIYIWIFLNLRMYNFYINFMLLNFSRYNFWFVE